MTNTTRAIATTILSVAATACSNSKADSGEPAGTKPVEAKVASVACDAKALETFKADLSKANGYGIDLPPEAAKAEIAARTAAITGKPFAFTGCAFLSQGSDEVTFGAVGSEVRIGCLMQDGDAGVTAFRNAAMKFDLKKLRLDVRGTIALAGMNDFESLRPTACTISAHE